MKKLIRSKILSSFKESNSITKEDPYGAGPCPVCNLFAVGTSRHIGAPYICKNGHYFGGTCGHPECANTPVLDELKGGLADKKTLKDILKHHYGELTQKQYFTAFYLLKAELENGIKVELEHTDDPKIAEEIAMDHLWENPDYYKELKSAGIEEKQQINEMPYFNDVPDKNGQPLDLQMEKWTTEEEFKNFLVKLFYGELYTDEKQPKFQIENPEEFIKVLTAYDGDVLNPTTQFYIQFIRKFKANGRKITTSTVTPEDINYVSQFVVDAYNKAKELSIKV